jgi:hypothetical protein
MDGGSGGLTREQRRRIKRDPLVRVMENCADRCTECKRPFKDREATTGGRVGRRWAYVADCCLDRLTEIHGVGLFVALSPGEADRIWFEQNPRRSHRIRRVLEGEFAGTDATWAVVRQLEPGVRHRRGLKLPEGLVLPNDEAIAHTLFDTLSEAQAAGETQFPIRRLAERLAAVPQGGSA